MQRCKGQGIGQTGTVWCSAARCSLAWHSTVQDSRHFLWMSLVRLERETISWRANILARWVSSRHGAQRGCPQVLQKYMVSSSCMGRGWLVARTGWGSPAHPVCPTALTALVQHRSQLAHCASSSPSAELSTRNCRSRSTGGSPVPPLTTEGCLQEWAWGHGQRWDTCPGLVGQLWGPGAAHPAPVSPRTRCPYPQSGQRKRPSLARPRRQLAQKLW